MIAATRSLALSAIALLLSVGAAAQPGPSGEWHGTISTPGQALGVKVILEATADDGWTGTIDIPMQGASGLALEDVGVDGSKVKFTIAGVPGTPTFEGDWEGASITGDFSQAGMKFPFELERPTAESAAELAPKRPQEPKPPFPYRAEDVSYQNGDIALAGTLTLPEGAGPHPAALMITGSGAQNRDEALLGHKPFLVIADHLTRGGIAVLRVDDRGVGGSSGSTSESTSADFAGDVLAGVRFLRARDDIAVAKVGVVGHSEGGLVGPLAASQSSDIAFVVMLAGPGVPGGEILVKQLELINRASGLSSEQVDKSLVLQSQIVDLLRSDRSADEVAEAMRPIIEQQIEMAPGGLPEGTDREQIIKQGVASVNNAWFRYFVSFDPRTALSKVAVPVLALNGSLDLQVDADQNLPEVGRALMDAGNTDVTLRRLEGLNHLFQHATNGSPAEYAGIEETFAAEVLEMMRHWIAERFL